MIALPLTALELGTHVAWLLLLVALGVVFVVAFGVGLLVAWMLSRQGWKIV